MVPLHLTQPYDDLVVERVQLHAVRFVTLVRLGSQMCHEALDQNRPRSNLASEAMLTGPLRLRASPWPLLCPWKIN